MANRGNGIDRQIAAIKRRLEEYDDEDTIRYSKNSRKSFRFDDDDRSERIEAIKRRIARNRANRASKSSTSIEDIQRKIRAIKRRIELREEESNLDLIGRKGRRMHDSDFDDEVLNIKRQIRALKRRYDL